MLYQPQAKDDQPLRPDPAPRRSWRVVLVISAWIVYWIALIVATHLPPPKVSGMPGNDKLLHFLAFGGLAVLTSISVLLLRQLRFRGWIGLFAILVIYAAIDEITQSFVGRSTELGDWLADSIGIAVGLSFVALSRYLLTRKSCVALRAAS